MKCSRILIRKQNNGKVIVKTGENIAISLVFSYGDVSNVVKNGIIEMVNMNDKRN